MDSLYKAVGASVSLDVHLLVDAFLKSAGSLQLHI